MRSLLIFAASLLAISCVAAQAFEEIDIPLEGRCKADVLYFCSHTLTARQRTSTLQSQSQELMKTLESAWEDIQAKKAGSNVGASQTAQGSAASKADTDAGSQAKQQAASTTSGASAAKGTQQASTTQTANTTQATTAMSASQTAADAAGTSQKTASTASSEDDLAALQKAINDSLAKDTAATSTQNSTSTQSASSSTTTTTHRTQTASNATAGNSKGVSGASAVDHSTRTQAGSAHHRAGGHSSILAQAADSVQGHTRDSQSAQGGGGVGALKHALEKARKRNALGTAQNQGLGNMSTGVAGLKAHGSHLHQAAASTSTSKDSSVPTTDTKTLPLQTAQTAKRGAAAVGDHDDELDGGVAGDAAGGGAVSARGALARDARAREAATENANAVLKALAAKAAGTGGAGAGGSRNTDPQLEQMKLAQLAALNTRHTGTEGAAGVAETKDAHAADGDGHASGAEDVVLPADQADAAAHLHSQSQSQGTATGAQAVLSAGITKREAQTVTARSTDALTGSNKRRLMQVVGAQAAGAAGAGGSAQAKQQADGRAFGGLAAGGAAAGGRDAGHGANGAAKDSQLTAGSFSRTGGGGSQAAIVKQLGGKFASGAGSRDMRVGGRSTAAGGAGGAHHHRDTTLLGAHAHRDFHKHEIDEMKNKQGEVSEVLRLYNMDPGLPVAALLSATAPIARCLRQSIRESQFSISPSVPQVTLECQEEVRAFLVDRAADPSRDPPLLVACADGILKHCKNSTQGPGQLFHCLKGIKNQLSPLCRSAVITRQISGSEDISLDPVLSAACSADRQRLCTDVGWGEGAAQQCLERVLHEDLLSEMKSRHSHRNTLGAKGAGRVELGLSPACAAALFRRQVEESQDIRFNYRLSHACAGDKHMFCRDVRPGIGDVVGCLEQHSSESTFTDACRDALLYYTQLRATDVRLDSRFRAVCSRDVKALCLDLEAKILDSVDEPPGAGARVMECMRRVREDIRSDACESHVTSIMRRGYQDNRLDVLLMDRCEEDSTKLCIDRRSTLDCLRAKLAMHEPLQPECAEMVRERVRQAASDLSFMPQLQQACVTEVATLCTGPHLTGAKVIDCLADHRNEDTFGKECHDALMSHLSDAVSDVRMLHTLQEDCRDDIAVLCNSTKPGEGRVLACLQEERAWIESAACKKQMLRMLGLAVEDYRLDYTLSQACKADVQQMCAGVDPNDTGAVHECLRKSRDHLSPDCKAAQDRLETMEHEDVRLNPRIQKECPLAISMFCGGEVAPGSASVITCLQQSMNKPNFPEGCRVVMESLVRRSSLKYSLNPKLKAACDQDVGNLCAGANDEPQNSTDVGILGCLATHSSKLRKPCRVEMAALVRLHLNNYHVGMPLTTACDQDVEARCNVDKKVTPFLQSGYILSCLSKYYNQIDKSCWTLISMFDEGQIQSAATIDTPRWSKEFEQKAIAKIKQQVVAEVKGDIAAEVKGAKSDLETKVMTNMETKLETAVQEQHHKIRPLLVAVVNAASILIACVAVLTLVAWFLWKKYIARRTLDPRLRTLAIKDARV